MFPPKTKISVGNNLPHGGNINGSMGDTNNLRISSIIVVKGNEKLMTGL